VKGYGRGYYGDEQLARSPRRGIGWGKVALVVGVGAVIWLMWPRKSEAVYVGDIPNPPQPPPDAQVPALPALPQATALPQQAALPPPPPPQHVHAQIAESRGYPSQKAYEDAVVENALKLKAAGAQITFAPHLAHLASRLV
jgi:hypothetical protein